MPPSALIASGISGWVAFALVAPSQAGRALDKRFTSQRDSRASKQDSLALGGRPVGVSAVVKVMTAVLGQHGMPPLSLPGDAGESAGLKGAGGELVALVGPGAVRASVGDPPEDIQLAGGRLRARHTQRSTGIISVKKSDAAACLLFDGPWGLPSARAPPSRAVRDRVAGDAVSRSSRCFACPNLA
jgi:hypothetical protein